MINLNKNTLMIADAVMRAKVDEKSPTYEDGAFKSAWRVDMKGKSYVLKRSEYTDMGNTFKGSTRFGQGYNDLMEEIYYQEHEGASYLLEYIAWGMIANQFYALQPMATLQPSRDADNYDEFMEAYSKLRLSMDENFTDCDPSHNVGMYQGEMKVYDWGYDTKVCGDRVYAYRDVLIRGNK